MSSLFSATSLSISDLSAMMSNSLKIKCKNIRKPASLTRSTLIPATYLKSFAILQPVLAAQPFSCNESNPHCKHDKWEYHPLSCRQWASQEVAGLSRWAEEEKNEAWMSWRAEKENRVPNLNEEIAKQQFGTPLKNPKVARKVHRDYNHLTQGKDLPQQPLQPSNVGEAKVNFLMLALDHPELPQNFNFRMENIGLKSIPFYIRYGSTKSSYEAYCNYVQLD